MRYIYLHVKCAVLNIDMPVPFVYNLQYGIYLKEQKPNYLHLFLQQKN